MTVYPFAIHLGPLELTGYGLMMMVAFLMAGWAIQLDLRARGLDEDYAADIIIAGVIGGVVGAKLWYVLLTHNADMLFRRGGVEIGRASGRERGEVSWGRLPVQERG